MSLPQCKHCQHQASTGYSNWPSITAGSVVAWAIARDSVDLRSAARPWKDRAFAGATEISKTLAVSFVESSATQAPNEFRCAPFRGEHSSQEKQVGRLYRLYVDALRLRRCWKFDAKFFQPLLSAGRPRARAGYHLPACAPPSTCSISPVVNVASVRNKTASTTSLISPILPRGCNPLRNS